MQVVLHTGAHFTDEDRLLKSLGKNRDMLADLGVALPKPRSYRNAVKEMMQEVRRTPLAEGHADAFLDSLHDISDPGRIVLSNSNFYCVPRIAVRDNMFYPYAADRLANFLEVFSNHQVEMFMALRDPATFLPALLGGTPLETLDELTAESVPTALRWSELIRRIQSAVPQLALTVWCNEDTPLIWEQLLREMAGLDPHVVLEGDADLLGTIMSPDGLARYEAYVAERPGLTQMQKRRVISAFLDKFALEDEVEEELDLPGWTEEYVNALSEIYDEDVFEISRMPGVNFISP